MVSFFRSLITHTIAAIIWWRTGMSEQRTSKSVAFLLIFTVHSCENVRHCDLWASHLKQTRKHQEEKVKNVENLLHHHSSTHKLAYFSRNNSSDAVETFMSIMGIRAELRRLNTIRFFVVR